MQSFGAPRPTSNPYVHMLDAALAAEPSVEHLRFNRTRALLGRYDVLHLHWPETLLGGGSPFKRFARRAYTAILIGRLRLGRIAVVRTMHNLELPDVDSAWERRLLQEIDRRADFHILLNDLTPLRDGVPAMVIPHGDYREWFSHVPPAAPTPRALGFVGLVRRYKGIEALMDAFAGTSGKLSNWHLEISGNPSNAELADDVRGRAARDARITVDLRYLSEEDFAAAVMRAVGIVLPYRFMHNSGTALAALSLGRPVLVPRNDVNEALADEVGAGWVRMFDGDLTSDDLVEFARECSQTSGAPDLTDRGWDLVGARHGEAYRRAIAQPRGKGGAQ
ncbi:MAG: glycosyl transferase [Microbacterium sp.]